MKFIWSEIFYFYVFYFTFDYFSEAQKIRQLNTENEKAIWWKIKYLMEKLIIVRSPWMDTFDTNKKLNLIINSSFFK